MDFKKFGTVVLILGLIVLLYGGFQWVSNQPKKFNQAESGTSVFGGRDDLGNMLNVQMTNLSRAGNRDNAIKILIAGGIVAFVGWGTPTHQRKKSNSYATYGITTASTRRYASQSRHNTRA
ncbi:hypothetical protein PITCH_A1650001 [uncultured Desulfobacterium sp.]|uniref:Uncharacterized protein n=1 Tax=uncultured Desulfobacterium sp. TaxID=201089 RepID=A0A445MUB3_9BACT|nr:hypothetical protein PITCH_A1650001 [uncultured Desulfobacterium sp.]